MKFLGKWMDLEDIILSEVTQSQKNTHYTLTNKCILAQKHRIPKIQFPKHMKLKKKEEQSVITSFLLPMRNKIPMEGAKKFGVEAKKKGPSRDCPTRGSIS